MPDFFEEVFAAQVPAKSHRRRRRPDEGLSGSGRRYAMLLTLMVSLTAVPTWIMLRAGVDGLDQHAAVTVQPLLPHDPPQSTAAPARETELEAPPRLIQPVPPAPPPPQPEPRTPLLERRSVVDTSSRPVRKKPAKPAKPAQKPAPSQDRDNCPAIAGLDAAGTDNCPASAQGTHTATGTHTGTNTATGTHTGTNTATGTHTVTPLTPPKAPVKMTKPPTVTDRPKTERPERPKVERPQRPKVEPPKSR